MALATCATIFVSFFVTQSLQAQGQAPARVDKTANQVQKKTANLPYCDEVLSKASKELQTQADNNCETAVLCVQCLERASKAEIYATMYAQPKLQRCKAAVDITTPTKVKPSKPDINFEIYQSVCLTEGVNLKVVFPEGHIDPANYSVTWDVDGNPFAKGREASCVCGKKATVTVTDNVNKRSVQKIMDLQNACKTSPPKE